MRDGPQAGYSREEARRVLGISEAQLRTWEKQELLPHLSAFGFSDLIAVRTLQRLRADRVPPLRIRRAVTALRKSLHGVSEPLKELKIFSEGKRIAVLIDGQKVEPVSGQLLLDFDAAELNRLLSFPTHAESPRATAVQKEQAELWFQKGLEMEQTGAPPDECIEAYEKAIELDPFSAGAMVNLGTIHYHLRKWSEAEKWYKKAIEADAAYPLAHFNLANLYDERGHVELAATHYRKAIELNPKYGDAHYNLALLYQGHGDLMMAVRHWKTYLKLDGGSTWAAIARRELDKLTKAAVVTGARDEGKASGLGVVS